MIAAAKAQPPPIRDHRSWGPSYLDDRVTEVWHGLPRGLASDAEVSMSNCPAKDWASGCSGTECPSWPLHSIARASKSKVELHHICSAERDLNKAKWSLDAHAALGWPGPEQLFEDVWDLARVSAYNIITQFREFPKMLRLFVFIMGFVCKSVSNVNAAKNTGAIGDWSTQTGNTFLTARRVMEQRRPFYGLLENVLGAPVSELDFHEMHPDASNIKP